MAVSLPLCSMATPAARSGCSESRLPDRCHSACTFRSDYTAGPHARHHDRCRRRCSSSCQDRQLVARAQLRYYQALPGHHRSSSTEYPTGSVHKRTPRPAGISLTVSCFFPPTTHAGKPAAVCYGIASLPAVLLPGGRVFLPRWHTVRRYVSGLLLLSPFECLYREQFWISKIIVH